jgi:hypothetical protein
MTSEWLKNIEEFYTKGDYAAAAKLISSEKLWRYSSSPKLLRQQEVISKYAQLNTFDLGRLLGEFLRMIKEKPMGNKVFIVHGWDHELKLEVKNYLQNTLKLECIVLHEQDGEGDTIINKFEKYAGESGMAVALLSEADAADQAAFGNPDAPKRPRPNVLFELGYFFSRLGRRRVLILKKGNVEIHSDILGIEYIDVTNGIESAGERIRKRVAGLLSQ